MRSDLSQIFEKLKGNDVIDLMIKYFIQWFHLYIVNIKEHYVHPIWVDNSSLH